MPIGSPQWMYASGEDFTLDQSLRFEDGRSTYLSRTPAADGNRRTWTMSYWIKRGSIADHKAHFGGSEADSESVALKVQFDGTTQQLQIANYRSGYGIDWICKSNMGFRDTSAWYHIVIAVDTTQGTDTNRVKLYANGELLTLTTATYPDENFESFWNENNLQVIGCNTDNEVAGSFYEGYMAEMHFIDGTALTPTSFGETGTYGEWKAKEVTGLTYGTNGFYLSFAGGGVMSATGGASITTDGDYKYNTFTADGTFTPSADGYVEYLVIAGGGGGGVGLLYNIISGGGGAGGYLTGYTAVTGSTAYSIVVGDGGIGGRPDVSIAANGDNSTALGLTAVGGGGGAVYNSQGATGGSGGGTGLRSSGHSPFTGGSGTAGQGNDGGNGTQFGGTGTQNSGGGGGGSGTAGGAGSTGTGGAGGSGTASSITGSAVTRAGGGGGGGRTTGGSGGSGGGGAGHGGDGAGSNATVNGSGGGGGTSSTGSQYNGGDGSNGIVILRYKFQ